jgi:aminoglycoside phosphotransferase
VTAPPAAGARVEYAATPARLRHWVEETLRAPVVSAVTQPGGFSPGVAARLTCQDGTRAFCKAVSSAANEDSPEFHRREQRITAALPATAPVPRLIAVYDDGEWVGLLLADVDGRQPTIPWQPDELARVIRALDDLSEALTPNPCSEAPSLAAAEAHELDCWQQLQAGVIDPSGLDEWCKDHLDDLAGLESGWVAATAGDTLLHLDLRADNLLLSSDRVWVVDWPAACVGKPWVDIATFAPSVAMQGGPPPDDVLAMSAIGRAADPGDLAVWICALTGYFLGHALLAPPPGLPTVREFQYAQGVIALDWLRRLTGW